MNLATQKRIAASVLNCGVNRVHFDESAATRIKEAITKQDIRGLVKAGIIRKEQAKGISRVRANKRIVQRRKGQQQGSGTRKGRATARLPSKERWMAKVRSQRALLKELREKGTIDQAQFAELYKKVKGDYFRSRRHIMLTIGTEEKA
jgi:large subunit ribosomal protein L19e